MANIDSLVFAGAALLLLAILASAVSYRIGMPLLLVFLAVGMLAGEDGPGGIVFNDFGLAYSIGTVALAVILLNGGLNTRADTFRAGLKPAFVLATLGVLITCVITGLFAAWILDFGLLQGMLVGAVVGSTDAAAVFALLNAKGLTLTTRVSATLEIESGSNDPMAVFLTVALLELILAGQTTPTLDTLLLFIQQMGGGILAGLVGGMVLVWLTHRLPLERGMYPMLILAGGLAIYGLTTVAGASGFMAVYLAGVYIGNRSPRELRGIIDVSGGMAWLAQLAVFLMLGLLATPSHLVHHAGGALAIALVLIFLARPLAVWLCLLPFHFPPREQVFIAWVGLRGAVPIILALFPLMAGLPEAITILDVAFFVVLISLALQGWTIPALAHRLRLEVPPAPAADERLDFPKPDGGVAMLGYRLGAGTSVLGRRVDGLRLPKGTRPIAVLRGDQALAPENVASLEPGDRLWLVARSEDDSLLSQQLSTKKVPEYLDNRVFFGDFTVNGDADLSAIAEQYNLPLEPGDCHGSVGEFLTARLGRVPVTGDRLRIGNLEFVVREVAGKDIRRVGLRIPTHLY